MNNQIPPYRVRMAGDFFFLGGVIVSLLTAFFSSFSLLGILIGVGGCLISWFVSTFMYAVAAILENSQRMVELMEDERRESEGNKR